MTLIRMVVPASVLAAAPPDSGKTKRDPDEKDPVKPGPPGPHQVGDDQSEGAPEGDPDQDGDGERGRKRRIGGTLVPYGVIGHPAGPFGLVRFAAGSVALPDNPARIKLLRDHDSRSPLGVAVQLANDTDGLSGAFRFGAHTAAIEAAALAADGILDSFSVGVDVGDFTETKVEGRTVTEVTAARLVEVSLVAVPAYAEAEVSELAATRKDPEMDPDATPIESVEDVLRRVLAEHVPGREDAGGETPRIPAQRRAEDPRITAMVDAAGYARPPGYTSPRGEHVTAGDYVSAFIRAHRDGERGELTRIQAAVGQGLADIPGLLPQVITGPMLGALAARRPVFDSLTARPMPGVSKTFERPRITTHTTAPAEQAAEGDTLTGGPMRIALESVTKRTIGTALDISHQALDWSSPAILDLVLADFMLQYVLWTEADISAAFAAAPGQTIALATDSGFELINKALYDAAALVYAGPTQNLPNTAWMSPDIWASIAGSYDDVKRPLFPFAAPANTPGSMPIPSIAGGGNVEGIKVVVGPKLPEGTLIVGDSLAVEVYEERKGLLRVEVPAQLKIQIAQYGYLAHHVAEPNALVAITFGIVPPAAKKTAAKKTTAPDPGNTTPGP